MCVSSEWENIIYTMHHKECLPWGTQNTEKKGHTTGFLASMCNCNCKWNAGNAVIETTPHVHTGTPYSIRYILHTSTIPHL